MIDRLKVIHDNVKIVEVINRYSPRPILNNKICCFCHTEKTPSCVLNLNTNKYYCFGCGAKGDVIDAVCNILNCDYKTAVDKIAQDFNLPYKGWLSNEEYKLMQDAERERKREKYKRQERERFILSANEQICNDLLWLRRRQTQLYPFKSDREKRWWRENKRRIRELEDIYLRLNGLLVEPLEYTQDEIIEKIKTGKIKI